MSLMDTIGGRKRIDISGLAAKVAARIARIAERKQPIIARSKDIQERYHEWHRREMQRPEATITTIPPQEVDDAIVAEGHKLAKLGREQYASTAADERAELEALTQDCEARYAAAVEAFDRLRDYQRGMSRYAATCGVPAMPALDDTALTDVALHGWRQRVASVLHPPAPRPQQRPADNPLVLG